MDRDGIFDAIVSVWINCHICAVGVKANPTAIRRLTQQIWRIPTTICPFIASFGCYGQAQPITPAFAHLLRVKQATHIARATR